MRGTLTSAAILAATALAVAAQAPQPEMARFRAGANLVRIDVYASRAEAAVTDLTVDDFEVFEDNAPQKVEAFELIQPRPAVSQEQRQEPRSLTESRAMAADPAARLFVLFYDLRHVSVAGAYHANKPVFEFVNEVIGQDDMVGVMTSDMSARDLSFARRTDAMQRYFTQNWAWGQRDQLITTDPVEEQLKDCYAGLRSRTGGLDDLISRHREMKTLDALDGLVTHLGGIREERKFVVLFTEGWRLHEPDPRSASPVEGAVPEGPRVGFGPGGRLTTAGRPGEPDFQACEQHRVMLAQADNHRTFQRLIERANSVNISFYPVDARGLQVYDERYAFNRMQPTASQTNARRDALYRLAHDTDGIAIVNTNNLRGNLARIVSDTSAYYLLSYYSTNAKPDGTFRRIRVRVKKPGIDVRARPGYLAPTEAEMRAGPAAAGTSAERPSVPDAITKALAAIDRAPSDGDLVAWRRGPTTGLSYVRSERAHYRRTERIRLEWPTDPGATWSGRVLTRLGQPLALAVTAASPSTTPDPPPARAEVVLAPLAPGDYVVELTVQAADRAATVSYYGFRIVP